MRKYTLLKNRTTGACSVRNNHTGAVFTEADAPAEYARLRKLAVANNHRAGRDDLMRDMGLIKVRGPVSGQTYWE